MRVNAKMGFSARWIYSLTLAASLVRCGGSASPGALDADLAETDGALVAGDRTPGTQGLLDGTTANAPAPGMAGAPGPCPKDPTQPSHDDGDDDESDDDGASDKDDGDDDETDASDSVDDEADSVDDEADSADDGEDDDDGDDDDGDDDDGDDDGDDDDGDGDDDGDKPAGDHGPKQGGCTPPAPAPSPTDPTPPVR